VLAPQVTGFRMTNCANIYCELEQVLTNGTGASADPGQHQVEVVNYAFGIIADKLGMDLCDVIMANIHTTAPSLEAVMAAGKQAIGWDSKKHANGKKTMSDGRLHGLGARALPAQTWGMIAYNVNLSLRPDGKVYMPYAEGIVGSYWQDGVRMVIAEETGMKIDDVIVYHAPNFPNWQQGDATDRGSTCTWAAKEAAVKLKATILNAVSGSFGGDVSALDIVDSNVVKKADGTVLMALHDLGAQYAVDYVGHPQVVFDATYKTIRPMAMDFAEVAVDQETGMVEILDYVCAHDFGKVIRQSSALGQLEQPATMSEGRALREEVIWDKNTGVMLNGNLVDYKVPTALDQPPIDTVPIETRCGGGAYGAGGGGA
jgi:xanthine dehydrogenase molybdenum-binding subunit